MAVTLSAARFAACKFFPYLSPAIMSMVPRPKPGLNTMAVDCHWRLYYDEKFLSRQPLLEAAGVVVHEALHLCLRHFYRATLLGIKDNPRLLKLWNVAADLAINGVIRQSGLKLPEGALYAEQYQLPDLQTTEFYFRELISREQQGEQPGESEEPQGSGEEPTAGQPGSSEGEDESEDSQPGEGSQGEPEGSEGDSGGSSSQGESGEEEGESGGEGDSGEYTGPQPDPLGGESGSCSDGVPREWEDPPPEECDTPGLDEAQAAGVVESVREAESNTRGQGAGRDAISSELNSVSINPRQEFMRYVRSAVDFIQGQGLRTYRRPSRINPGPGFVLGTQQKPVPRITVIIDTSGSMSSREMGMGIGLVKRCLESLRIRSGIRVITGDSAGNTQEMVYSDISKIKMVGGGGTNMATICQQAAEVKPKPPQLILVVTDGYTPWPSEKFCRTTPVVACLTRCNKAPDHIRGINLWQSVRDR